MLAVAVVSAVSGLLYGYDTGIISGALLQIGKEFDTGHGMEQVDRRRHPAGRGHRRPDLQPALRALGSAQDDPADLRGLHRRQPVLLDRAHRGPARPGARAARLRRRRRHPDRADVRRRDGARRHPRPPRPLLPAGHRRRHRHRHPGRRERVGGLADLDRLGRRTRADHAAAPAPPSREPALAGQAGPAGRGGGGAQAGPPRGLRHLRGARGDRRGRAAQAGDQAQPPGLERAAPALGPPGTHRRLRHRGVHPAVAASR